MFVSLKLKKSIEKLNLKKTINDGKCRSGLFYICYERFIKRNIKLLVSTHSRRVAAAIAAAITVVAATVAEAATAKASTVGAAVAEASSATAV